MNLLLTFPELLGCLVIMVVCAIRGLLVPADQWRTNWMLFAAAIQVPLQIVVVEVLHGLSLLRPLKYDLYVYWLDSFLGQPSFPLGRFSAHHQWFHIAMMVTYSQLVIMMIVAIGAYLWLRPRDEAIRALIAFAITFPVAVPLYLLLPVCGPVYAFPDFPFVQPHVIPHLMALSAAPNGFPSIHMATAILVFWYLRHWRVGQILGGLFLILTALSTMSSGQHYVLDLIFAVPYTYAMVYLAAKAWPAKKVRSVDPMRSVISNV